MGRQSFRQTNQTRMWNTQLSLAREFNRGFNIYGLVGMHQAEAELPAFTKGKTQLTAKEVRELAVVRIHVERLIGVIKQLCL